MKRIKVFKILFIITISLAPMHGIASAVLAIIFNQYYSTTDEISPGMAVVNFLSYACLVLAVIFLLVSLFFFGQMRRYQHRYYFKKVEENRDK